MRGDIMIVTGLACFAVAVILASMDNKTAQQEELTQYCELVEIGIETDGEYGWPDYKGIYDEEC